MADKDNEQCDSFNCVDTSGMDACPNIAGCVRKKITSLGQASQTPERIKEILEGAALGATKGEMSGGSFEY